MKYELIKITDNQIEIVSEELEKLRKLNAIKVKAEILEKEIKQELQEAMEEFGIEYIDTPVFKANLVKPTTTTRFNASKFKKDHADLHKEYMTTSSRKGYIKVEYHD